MTSWAECEDPTRGLTGVVIVINYYWSHSHLHVPITSSPSAGGQKNKGLVQPLSGSSQGPPTLEDGCGQLPGLPQETQAQDTGLAADRGDGSSWGQGNPRRHSQQKAVQDPQRVYCSPGGLLRA